ncbi:hypothetical protein OKW21_003370 [Catalinimonas alkaloidigena]|uniref:hypothetical protein n=1 Tax=Catalinimonas alkaloidigena TaxID=1075417 RepID=UPI002405E9D4|nr:hypothetical protein [Catalinimonas alkaloidigena]MDF9798107.1 hypothetical protein [Catalinimonas alkaloidigena]
MTTVININPNLFIDVEGAFITTSKAPVPLAEVSMKRDVTPISQIKVGKFRRLFNRHITAFRR